MALKTGISKLKHQLVSGWFPIGQQTTPTTAKDTITFNFNKLQNVNSNAAKNGLTAYVMGVAIVRHGKYALADNSGNNVYSAQINRDAFFDINVSQPNISTKMMKQDENLALMGLVSRVVNPAFCAMEDTLPPKQGVLQTNFEMTSPVSSYPSNFAPIQGSFDRMSSLNPSESWNDNRNFALVASDGGGETEFVDATLIPVCHFSGVNRYGGSMDKDIIPFSTLTNNNMPWTVTVTAAQNVADQFQNPTKTSDTMDVWAFVVFRKNSESVRCGVLWSLSHTPIGDGNYNPMPLYYRGIFLAPKFASATTVGIKIRYLPQDFYTLASTAQIRLLDNGEQVFPLDSYSEAQQSINHFNAGAFVGGNPRLRFDYFGSLNTTSPAYSDFDAATELAGFFSPMPLFPLVANHLFMDGFPVAFMSDPQNAESRLQVTYSVSLSDAIKASVISLHVSQYYDDDAPKLLSYGLYGDSNQPAGSRLGQIRPLFDEDKQNSMLVRKIVPWECPR